MHTLADGDRSRTTRDCPTGLVDKVSFIISRSSINKKKILRLNHNTYITSQPYNLLKQSNLTHDAVMV